MPRADHIGDTELNAYVDGQLALGHRLEIEERLAGNPELATRVMADLGVRHALRLAFSEESASTSVQTRTLAHKLQGALGRRRILVPLRRAAAAVALFALGWGASLGWMELNRLPDQQALLAKAARLGETVDVRLPSLPKGWAVVDARLAETPEGAGVKLTFDTPEFGHLSLIARNTSDIGIVLPTVNTDEDSKIHWQFVSDRYELTSDLTGKPLEYAALELYQTLY